MTTQTETSSIELQLTDTPLANVSLNHQMVVILDFGSQYSELIARRIRETQVYSEVISYRTTAEQLKLLNPKGIILSGGRVRCTTSAHPNATPKSGIWEFPFWACVMECN